MHFMRDVFVNHVARSAPRVDETSILGDVLAAHLADDAPEASQLQSYRESGAQALHVLMLRAHSRVRRPEQSVDKQLCVTCGSDVLTAPQWMEENTEAESGLPACCASGVHIHFDEASFGRPGGCWKVQSYKLMSRCGTSRQTRRCTTGWTSPERSGSRWRPRRSSSSRSCWS